MPGHYIKAKNNTDNISLSVLFLIKHNILIEILYALTVSFNYIRSYLTKCLNRLWLTLMIINILLHPGYIIPASELITALSEFSDKSVSHMLMNTLAVPAGICFLSVPV